MDRRSFLSGISAASLSVSLPLAGQAFGINDVRTIKLYNVHNHEVIHAPYWKNGKINKKGLKKLDRFFRDWRSGSVKKINTDIYHILYSLQEGLGIGDDGIHLISGYRSPQTNDMLRKKSSGVAKNSLHIQGLAADIRAPNVKLKSLHRAAKSLKAGGVGFYQVSNFIHIDNGSVRYW